MGAMTPRTLRDAIETADAARFVGRENELRAAEDLFDEGTPSRVFYVHGPAGIGKSAYLRAVRRIGQARGLNVCVVDTQNGLADLERQVATIRADHATNALVLIDDVDFIGAKIATMRDRLLDILDDSSRLVVAGRTPPEHSWRVNGLDAVIGEIELRELSDESAARLLTIHRVAAHRVNELVRWAHGSPLALTVAGLSSSDVPAQPDLVELEERVTAWISGQHVLDIAPDLLEVAALAPVVDARLLAAALPSRSTRDAMTQLFSLAVIERVGDRAVLHRVLADAIRTRLRELSPERYRTLARRIVEHLGSRARLGDIAALVEMSEFITDPHMKQAVSNRPSLSLFSDRPGPDELKLFASEQGFDQGADWGELADFDATQAPYRLVIRHVDGSIVLYGAFARADKLEASGSVTASLRSAVSHLASDSSRVFAGFVLFADVDPELVSDAGRLGGGALMHRHGVPDMLAVAIHYPEPDRRPIEVVEVLAQPATGALSRPVMLSNFSPGGAVGFVEAIVLSDLGFPARNVDLVSLIAANDDPHREQALRSRLDEVFDNSPADQRLRRAIELAHIGPKRSVDECLEIMHVSRRTWFRLLREARERVVG